ncbi:MAG: DUF4157 domain-containing protein [Anaerolineae bacterium]
MQIRRRQSEKTQAAPQPETQRKPMRSTSAQHSPAWAESMGVQPVPALQTKLTINEPGDVYEQEADAVAEQVMTMPDRTLQRTCACGGDAGEDSECEACKARRQGLQRQSTPEEEESPVQTKRLRVMRQATPEEEEPPIQTKRLRVMRQATPEEEEPPVQTKRLRVMRQATPEEEEPPVQTKRSGGGGSTEAPSSVRVAINRPGQPLSASTRAFMEPRFGRDFRDVRVHTDSQAADSARDISARAYTVGQDVVFGSGEYRPGSRDGDRLIAHELTHVVQQNGSAVLPYREPDEERIQRFGSIMDWAIDQLPDVVGDILDDIDEAGGVFEYIEKILGDVFDSIFGGLQDGAESIGDLLETFRTLYTSVTSLVAAIASNDRETFVQAVVDLTNALEKIVGDVWGGLELLLAPVGTFLDGVLETLDQPIEDWIESIAGSVWRTIVNIGRVIWDHTDFIRDAPLISEAWDAVRDWLGITGPDTYDSVVRWIEGKISDVWQGIKGGLSGVINTIRNVASTIRDVIALENIHAMRDKIIEWIGFVRQMALNLGDGDGAASNQDILRDILIPAIESGADFLRSLVMDAGQWFAGLIGQLTDKVIGFLDTVGAHSILREVVPELFAWVKGAVNDLSEWAQSTIVNVFNIVGDSITGLASYIRPVLDTLINLVSTVADLIGNLPNLLSSAWNAIPEWIREPIKDFVLNQVLGRIPIFSQIIANPDVWTQLQEAAMTILRQIFVTGDLMGAAWTFFETLLDVLNFPLELAEQVIVKAANVFSSIINDPIGFLTNMLEAVKLGFGNFFSRFPDHLLNGLQTWLLGQAAEAGIEPPTDWSLASIFQFVLDVLGINIDLIWERLALKIGDERVAQIRRVIDTLSGAWEWISIAINDGIGALWEKIQEKLSELWDQVIEGVTDYIVGQIIEKVTEKILTMFDPSGIMAVINSIIAVYNAIQSFIEYFTEMLEIVNKVLDGIQNVIDGVLDGAAAYLENALADAIPIAIGFLANQVGLGNLGEKLKEMIEKARGYVIRAVDWLIDQALRIGGALLGSVQSGVKSLVEWWRQTRDFKGEDGVPHVISFQRAGGSYKVIVESDPVAVEEFLNTQSSALNDITDQEKKTARQSHITNARQVLTQIRALVYPDQNQTAAIPQTDVEAQIAALLGQLSQHLQPLMGADSDKPVPNMVFLPGFSNSQASSPTKVHYLFAGLGNHEDGTGTPKGENRPNAYLALEAQGTSVNWALFHILNEKLGGKGVESNLIIMPEKENKRYEHIFEKKLKIWYKENKVLWMQAEFTPHNTKFDQPSYQYIHTFEAEGGVMEYQGNQWQPSPDPELRASFPKVTVEHPYKDEPIKINLVFRAYQEGDQVPLNTESGRMQVAKSTLETTFDQAIQQGITYFHDMEDLASSIATALQQDGKGDTWIDGQQGKIRKASIDFDTSE